MRQDWLPGAVSTLGTIANGVAIGWVKNRRSDAVREEEKAFDQVKALCENTRAAEEFAQHMRLMGTMR